MIPGPDLRIAVGYLIVMKLGVSLWLAHTVPGALLSSANQPPQSWRLRWLKSLLSFLYVGPLVIWVFGPAWLWSGQIPLPAGWSWIGIAPAAAAIVLWGWSFQKGAPLSREGVTTASDQDGARGPYRWIRYPCELCDALFYISAAWVAANWIVLIGAAAVTLAVRLVLIPQLETGRRAAWGPEYDAVRKSTGVLLPVLGPKSQREYTVPKRFGMAAIVALLTTFGIVFGVLRYWQTPPVVYLFVASEIVAICLAQILFGSAPRIGSIATGAVLLPFWVSLTVEDRLVNLMSPEVFWISVVTLVAFGGLLGYCIGALAAGFFLVMDMLDGSLPGQTSAAADNPLGRGLDARR